MLVNLCDKIVGLKFLLDYKYIFLIKRLLMRGKQM